MQYDVWGEAARTSDESCLRARQLNAGGQRTGGFFPLALSTALIAVVSSGCDDFFRVTSDSNPDLTATMTPSSNATVGGGPEFFGEIAGDMGRVDYQADSEKRMFLLDSTLEAERSVFGVPIPVFPEARKFIRLPASNDQERGFPISALDATKPWRSARLYDSGMCSSLAPLDFPGSSLVAQIPEGIRDAMIENDGVVEPELEG